MKHYILSAVLVLLTISLFAQRTIRDRHITNQQERMVFKQWSQSKFTPTSGFLGLNPNYLLTWAWHPDYPKTDLRPLGPVGQQTQRLAFAAAMQQTDNAYKFHADTLKNTALSEAVNYSAVFSRTDPLWQLYYRHELEPLLNQQDDQLLNGITVKERGYLIRTGVYQWFKEESVGVKERLESAMDATLDRGSRILAYHRLLLEYRKLNASWQAKKLYARRFLSLSETAAKIRSREESIAAQDGSRSDRQIADDILSRSKL